LFSRGRRSRAVWWVEEALTVVAVGVSSRYGRDATDAAVIKKLTQPNFRNWMFEYVRPARCATSVECVVDAFDVVGVAELFDESMVLLADVVGVPLSSVLYLPAKVSSASRHPPNDNNNTTGESAATTQSSSAGLRAFFASPAWLEANELDYALYAAARRRLEEAFDRTPKLRADLETFRATQHTAVEACGSLQNETTSSSAASRRDWCYWGDNGCGFECMDRLFGM